MSGENREITGYERLEFTAEWISRGRPRTREEFIKKVCEVKGITYKPAKKYRKERNVIVTNEANMFPTKNKEDSRDE